MYVVSVYSHLEVISVRIIQAVVYRH